MHCSNCNSDHVHVRYIPGMGEFCNKCGNFPETSGARTSGLLSRTRSRMESVKAEGDTLQPHRYNKQSRTFEVNPDFVKLHSKSADAMITPAEARASHMPKLAEKIEHTIKAKKLLKNS